MWIIFVYLPVSLVIFYIFLNVTWHLWKRKYTFLPNACNVPWLGCALQLGSTVESFSKALESLAKKYNYLYILWIGPLPYIRTGCVEYIEPILRSYDHISKTALYKLLHDWLGLGLITSTGVKWKKRRTALTGAFHFSILNDFNDIFIIHAQHLCDKLREYADTRESVDVAPILTLSTLDVICETSMGVKINALHSSESQYVQAVHNVKELIFLRIVNPLVRSKFIYKLTSNGKKFYKNLEILHNFTIGVINENLANRRSNNSANHQDRREETLSTINCKKKCFLDLLIDLYEQGEIDIEGIREEVDTFMFAGHDTTASAMSFILYEIGRHPHVQKTLHREIDHLSSQDSTIIEKIRNFKYLDNVIKECLRMHPPVPGIGRKIDKEIKICKNTIPAGTLVGIEPFNVHMNPLYWDEPAIFKPERFESESFLKRNPYCYIPFSAGPRNCIGQKFAMMELKVYMYHILSSYHIKSTQRLDELIILRDIVSRSANGIHIEFYSR